MTVPLETLRRLALGSLLGVALCACGEAPPASASSSAAAELAPGTPEASEARASTAKTEGPSPELPESGRAESGRASPGRTSDEAGRSPLPGGNEHGPIYLVINTKGLVELDHEGARLISETPTRNISDLFVGPDGVVYVVDAEALRAVKGGALVEVERFALGELGPIDSLVVAADASLWVTNHQGVGQRVDGEWSFTPFAEIGAERGFAVRLSDVGRAWLVGERAAFYFDEGDQAWKPSAPGLWRNLPALRDPTSSPTGPVHAVADFKLVRLHEEVIDGVLLDPKKTLSYSAGLSLASDGDAGLVSQACDLIRVNAHPPTKMWRFAGSKYRCQTPEALALDGSERFWVASREGLSLVTDTRQVREYPAGSFEAIAGRVSHMVAVGLGPVEAPTVGRVQAAGLRGTILYGGKPAAEVPLELCPSVRLDGEGTPCSAARTRYSTTTDASGAFEFASVAIGDYSFAAEFAGEWRWSTPPTFAAKLRSGEAHDVGAIAFPKN